MENNEREVQGSETLREGARALTDRALAMAALVCSAANPDQPTARGGRKAHALEPLPHDPLPHDPKAGR
jgi:hypothetical protein